MTTPIMQPEFVYFGMPKEKTVPTPSSGDQPGENLPNYSPAPVNCSRSIQQNTQPRKNS
ncbi:hypothetical protein F444_02252 [Phytophthora nicotianae P1976]|uniref:Uncharacterized protein n=1 Tax=Phytophthora nicotianae P1976 TaxID=1317066 RepID=A0A081AY20_PHYNI|nr:hypothetical protein F444_02252 [Phytophthora nicotianae P1976]